MHFRFYIEKLHGSEIYKKFIAENHDAYLCSGFFTINKTNGEEQDQQHLDFYVPKEKKFLSFHLEEDIKLSDIDIPVAIIEQNIPEEIPAKCNFDFEEIENMIISEMEKQNVNNKLQKILLSIQSKHKICYLIGTLFISNLGIIKIRINLHENKITEFEKKSFFDMLKVIKGNKEEAKEKDKKEKENIDINENKEEEN